MNRAERSQRYRPRLEGLEPRELPSGLHAAVATPVTSGTPPWVSRAVLQQVATSLYAPVTTTTDTVVNGQTFPPGTYAVPQPTPAEIRRETFWLQFNGRYYVGPPRFSDQSATIRIFSNGRNVSSNQSLHGRAEMVLFPPSDPSATPTMLDPKAGQVAGLLGYFPADVLQSGSQFFAEISNRSSLPSSDPKMLDHGLPSHMQFTLDPGGVTGGVYAVPAYTVVTPTGLKEPVVGSNGGPVSTQGVGVLDIHYIPGRHGARSGQVVVRMQGLINTTGVTNPLYKGIN